MLKNLKLIKKDMKINFNISSYGCIEQAKQRKKNAQYKKKALDTVV